MFPVRPQKYLDRVIKKKKCINYFIIIFEWTHRRAQLQHKMKLCNIIQGWASTVIYD